MCFLIEVEAPWLLLHLYSQSYIWDKWFKKSLKPLIGDLFKKIGDHKIAIENSWRKYQHKHFYECWKCPWMFALFGVETQIPNIFKRWKIMITDSFSFIWKHLYKNPNIQEPYYIFLKAFFLLTMKNQEKIRTSKLLKRKQNSPVEIPWFHQAYSNHPILNGNFLKFVEGSVPM